MTVCNASLILQKLETKTNEKPLSAEYSTTCRDGFSHLANYKVSKGLCLQRLEGPSVPVEFSQYLGCLQWTKGLVVLT